MAEAPRLTHLKESGEAHMVSTSAKAPTARTALAEGFLSVAPATLVALREGTVKKGDAFAVSRVAGIMAAKKTSDLIPLCHPIAITGVEVELVAQTDGVRIRATVETMDRTGVEMEALTAVAVSGLALYDMVKAMDRSAVLKGIRLMKKEGGKSGLFLRPEEEISKKPPS